MSSTQNNNPSYSNALQSTTNITKECAIVLPLIENFEWREVEYDYIVAIAKLTDAQNIISVFPTSMKRIIVYFQTKEQSIEFVKKHPTITIRNLIIPVRCLITPAKRLIISGVHPFIQNNTIAEKLKSYNIKLMSEVTSIKVNLPVSNLRHILTARRQVFFDPECSHLIPDTLDLIADGEQYILYLFVDDNKCKTCNSNTHSTQRCRQSNQSMPQMQPINQTSVVQKNIPPSQTINPPETAGITLPVNERELSLIDFNLSEDTSKNTQVSIINPVVTKENMTNEKGKGKNKSTSSKADKRTYSQGSSSDELNQTSKKLTVQQEINTIENSIAKTLKWEQQEYIKDLMMKLPDSYSISYNTLTKYLETLTSKTDPIAVSKEMDLNNENIIDTLRKIQPELNKTLKPHITRIITKLTLGNEIDQGSSKDPLPSKTSIIPK